MTDREVFRSNLLANQVALITGGGSGIGATIASTFAKHGARVVLLGRTAEKLESTAAKIEQKTLCTIADVRDYRAVEGGVERAIAEFGRLDIVVNAAAGNFVAPAAGLSSKGFQTVIDIDLVGTFNTCRASFEALSKQGGSVLNITATQAWVATPLQCHAGAAKAGIAKLTQDLALEWARVGIRVNAIAPGPIDETEGMRRLAPTDPEARERLVKGMPLGRFGTKLEVAQAALFLCSPAAGFITGASLCIDGGQSLMGSAKFMSLMGMSS